MKIVALGLVLGGGCYLIWRYNNRAISVNLKPLDVHLPEEVMFNILSYLPVKSLLRFKRVCKRWNDLITLDTHFLYLHYQRSPSVVDKEIIHDYYNDQVFVVRSMCAGLTLESSIVEGSGSTPPSFRYRVRNLAMQQVLELPNPQNPSLDMDIQFFPSDRRFKLVSLHKGENDVLGYEVLDLILGTNNENSSSNCLSWRPLVVPPNSHNSAGPTGKKERIRIMLTEELAYCIWDIKTPQGYYIQVDILDMKNERYIGNTICPKVLNSLYYYAVISGGKLSVFRRLKKEFHVLVLENYKRHKWAEKTKVINKQLTCLKEEVNEPIMIRPCYTSGSKFLYDLFLGCNFYRTLHDDSSTRKLTVVRRPDRYHADISDVADFFVAIKPSLITVKGMRFYSSTQAIARNPLYIDSTDRLFIPNLIYDKYYK